MIRTQKKMARHTDNTNAMIAFIPHIKTVNRQGRDWLCSLKNGWRLIASDSLMTTTAQMGK